MRSDEALLLLSGIGIVAAAMALSAFLCALVIRWSDALGFLDKPGGHKGHANPVALGGGVAIWLTLLSLTLIGVLALRLGREFLPESVARYAEGVKQRSGALSLILFLASLIMGMGLLDDRKALSWWSRLGIQVGLAIVLAAAGIRVTLFGLGPLAHPLVGGLVTVFWIVGLTNAFNFLDNMDGLAAGVGLIAALLFAAAQIAVGSLFVPALLLGLVGALAGFLVHNRHPARLFMGDAGSNFIGFLLGSLTVAGTYYRYGAGESRWGVLAPLLVMAVPLYDTASVILIRLKEGRSPFLPDRCHLSHRLVDRGLTRPQAVRTIYLVTLASGLGALLLHKLDGFGAVVVSGQTVCLLGVVALLEVSRNRAVSDRAHVPVPVHDRERADVEAKNVSPDPRSRAGT